MHVQDLAERAPVEKALGDSQRELTMVTWALVLADAIGTPRWSFYYNSVNATSF